MELLVLSHSYKKIHQLLVKEMIACLERNNHRVSSEMNPAVTYDGILIFNRKALKRYQAASADREIPVIYLFCLSDIAEEYPVSDSVTKIIVLKDKMLNVKHLLVASLTYQDMLLPADLFCYESGQEVESIRPDNKHTIYVNIEDDYLGKLTFLKMLPLLNLLQNYDIYYQSEKSIGRQFINKHIRLISSKCNVADCIEKANVVIASGYTAYLAVQQGKKTIVIGEKGYGGLVTEDNLEYHVTGFFQGRNGGKFDEDIPFSLLAQAIEAKMPDTQKILEKLIFLQNQNQKKWIQSIETVIAITRKKVDDCDISYILNPDYGITKKKNRIWLFKRVFGKLYISVNESEASVILAFRESHSLSEVLNTFPLEYWENIKEYIHELIMKKILIPFESIQFETL